MTREARNDIIICALVVSLAVHVAAMFWVRPKVMTTVAAGAARVARRGPMQVVKATERPEPVKIDIIKDVKAEKDAPEVAPIVTVAPVSDVVEPPTATDVKIPELSAPEVITRLAADDAATPMPEAERDVPAPREAPRMPSDAVSMANPGSIDTFALSPVFDLPTAPAFDAPDIEAAGPRDEPVPRIGDVVKAADYGRQNAEGKKAEKKFEPAAEVMPEVDEKVVEQEKAAVRGLVDVEDANELVKHVSTVVSSTTDGEWTYFRLRIMPKKSLQVVPKDVVVLIDASGSIGKDRMRSIRAAAKQILRSATNTGDRFNLVAFRDRFSYAFRRWQECTVESFDSSDKWLDRVVPHGRTDVFATIASVLTLPRDPTRPLIALVVTDGDANAGVSDTAEILSKFTALNDGLVSVYMYGVKSSANRELIDVLTRGNRGESFIFDGWRWSAGSGIEGLSERFRDPVLSDIKIVFSSATAAEAYPRRLKNLYRGETLEVSGRVPAGTAEVAFSMKGLNGAKAYEGFFRLSLASAAADNEAAAAWHGERAIDSRLR